jgi:hypothetical protein
MLTLAMAESADAIKIPSSLRSVKSPEVHAFRVELPHGALLKKRGRGAEIVRGRHRLGIVNPPFAWDADNRPVPVRMSVTRDRLRLVVPHRDADLAYPLIVDPLIENFQYWRTDPNVDWLYWWFDAPTGFDWSREGEWGRGAYLVTNGNNGADYPHTWSSYARFAAPGDAYVYAAEFNLLRHQPPSGGPMCVSAGIYSGAVNDYESPVWLRCGSFWDENYGTCVTAVGPIPTAARRWAVRRMRCGSSTGPSARAREARSASRTWAGRSSRSAIAPTRAFSTTRSRAAGRPVTTLQSADATPAWVSSAST